MKIAIGISPGVLGLSYERKLIFSPGDSLFGGNTNRFFFGIVFVLCLERLLFGPVAKQRRGKKPDISKLLRAVNAGRQDAL